MTNLAAFMNFYIFYNVCVFLLKMEKSNFGKVYVINGALFCISSLCCYS